MDQVIDHPVGDAHFIPSVTADAEYDASTLFEQKEGIKASLKDKLAIKPLEKAIEGSSDVCFDCSFFS